MFNDQSSNDRPFNRACRSGRAHRMLFFPAIAVLMFSCVAGPALGNAEVSAPCGRIVFSSNRTGNHEIYKMSEDGKTRWRLTRDEPGSYAQDIQPTLSADGSKIAWISDRGAHREAGHHEVWIMNADGTNQRQLTFSSPEMDGPAYYPEEAAFNSQGTQVAFVTGGTTGQEIFVINTDGTNRRMVVSTSGGVGDLSFSPDGTKIIYSASSKYNQGINVSNTDGSGTIALLRDRAGTLTHPAYSPDGTQIVFVSRRDDNLELYLVRADGSRPQRLTKNPGSDTQPAFTPDGRIVFVSIRGGRSDLYVMNSDGTRVRRLTSDAAVEAQPAAGICYQGK